jgi:hypothetical protein
LRFASVAKNKGLPDFMKYAILGGASKISIAGVKT